MCISNKSRRRNGLSPAALSALISSSRNPTFSACATIQKPTHPGALLADKIQLAATAETLNVSKPQPRSPPPPPVSVGDTFQHNYHDHACDPEDDGKLVTRGGVTMPFPLKLHTMIDKIEADGLAHVISWQPHGRCFMIHKPKLFANHVMPEYFKQSKFASFQRQLNLYGFNRLTAGLDRGGYYHEMFLRGRPFLSHKIHRMRVKGTGVRMASSPETEPNFYAMTPVQAPFHGNPDRAPFHGNPDRAPRQQQQRNHHAPSLGMGKPPSCNSFVPIKFPQSSGSPKNEMVANAPPSVVQHIIHRPYSLDAAYPNKLMYEYFAANDNDTAADAVPKMRGHAVHQQPVYSNPTPPPPPAPYVRQVTPPVAVPPCEEKQPPKQEEEQKQPPPPKVEAEEEEEPFQFEDDGMADFFKDIDLAFDLDEEQMENLFDDTSFGYMLEKAVDEM